MWTNCALGAFQSIRMPSRLLIVEAEVCSCLRAHVAGRRERENRDSDWRDGIFAFFSPNEVNVASD